MSDSSFPQQFDRIQQELQRLEETEETIEELEEVIRARERQQLGEVLENRLLEIAQLAAQEKLFERLSYPTTPQDTLHSKVYEEYPDTQFRVIGGKDLTERPGARWCWAHVVVVGNEGSVWVIKNATRRPNTYLELRTNPRVEPDQRNENPYWTTNLSQDRPARLTAGPVEWLPWTTKRQTVPFQAEIFWEEDREQPLEEVVKMVEQFQRGLTQARQRFRKELRSRTQRLDERKKRLDDIKRL